MTTDKLKKIYALALEGVGGEKEQAKAILDKLIEKYNISFEELDEEKVQKYIIDFHGDEEKKLMVQIAFKVTNKTDSLYGQMYKSSGRTCRTKAALYCTEAEKVNFDFLFDFYKQLWKKEKEFFFDAFVQKHRLFGDSPAGSNCEMSHEDYIKMIKLFQGMDDGEIIKRIPEKI